METGSVLAINYLLLAEFSYELEFYNSFVDPEDTYAQVL